MPCEIVKIVYPADAEPASDWDSRQTVIKWIAEESQDPE